MRGEYTSLSPPGLVVVVHLQCEGRFPAVHRAGVKVEVCHGPILPVAGQRLADAARWRPKILEIDEERYAHLGRGQRPVETRHLHLKRELRAGEHCKTVE